MSIKLHFTEEDWERIQRDWTAWWAGELRRPLVVIQQFSLPPGAVAPKAYNFASNYPLEMPADDVIDQYQACLEATHFYGDAWPKWWVNFGPGIVAGFLGALVHSSVDSGETVWFTPPQTQPLQDLRLTYNVRNPWWLRVQELTRRAVERWGNQVSVAHTDMGGNLDILASFRTTQQLLLDLYDSPGEVTRLAGEITRLWLRFYDELDSLIQPAHRGTSNHGAIWSPKRCYMLQCDFSYMISPKMFERFVLPDLAACCEKLDHSFYHMDGKGEIPHLDMLLSLERLRGIQWIPGDGAPPSEEWLPLLKRIQDGGKLCQLDTTPEGALKIVRALGGRGFVFRIQGEFKSDVEVRDFLRVIHKKSAN